MPTVTVRPTASSQMAIGSGPPESRSAAPVTAASAPRPTTTDRSIAASAPLCLENHSSAVGDDLAHRRADFRGIEPHHDDGVGAHGGGILNQPVDGVAPRLLQQAGIFIDL